MKMNMHMELQPHQTTCISPIKNLPFPSGYSLSFPVLLFIAYSLDQQFSSFSSHGTHNIITKSLQHTKKYIVVFAKIYCSFDKIGIIFIDLQKVNSN